MTEDPAMQARCGLCAATVEAVVSLPCGEGHVVYACPGCLRGRLEAITLGRWHLRGGEKSALPWGKIAG